MATIEILTTLEITTIFIETITSLLIFIETITVFIMIILGEIVCSIIGAIKTALS